MKTRFLTRSVLLTMLVGLCVIDSRLSTAFAQGTAITYQGRLADGSSAASGNYDFKFTAYDAGTGGSPVGTAVTTNGVAVSNGVFTATLDFGAGVFTGPSRWLQIEVRTNGAPSYALLTPRQALTPSPYAVFAPTAGTAATAASATVATTATTANGVAAGSVGTAGLAAGAVDSSRIADGTIAPGDLSPTVLSNTFWRLGGNAGTTSGTHFVGTTDIQPLELRVNNARALRIEPVADDSIRSNIVNLVGGSSANYISPGISGSVIGGGGAAYYVGDSRTNVVSADFSFLGGGGSNSIQTGAFESFLGGGVGNSIQPNAYRSVLGGGYGNSIQPGAPMSVLGGGFGNTVQTNAYFSVLAGGYQNSIQDTYSFLGGGSWNLIQTNSHNSFLGGGGGNLIQSNAIASVLGGGTVNTTAGAYSVVPGGSGNVAGGQYSFAAGLRAKALYQGDFVWADSLGLDFSSTAPNQFLIRASGNVGINKNNPATALDVNGTVTAGAFAGNGSGLTSVNADTVDGQHGWFFQNADNLLSGTVSDNRLSANVGLLNGTQTFTGAKTFNNAANSFSGNGSGLTFVNAFHLDGQHGSFYQNAGNLNAGTLSDSRLSGNVALLSATQAFTGVNTFAAAVGIGTPTPFAALLDVEGDIRLNAHDLYLYPGDDTFHGLGFYGGTKPFAGVNVNGPVLYGFGGGALGTTGSGQSIALAWNSSGNVGIGKANPATTLDVNGEVSAPTVTVTSQLRLTGARTVLAGLDGTGSHWFGPSPDDDLAFGIHRNAVNDYTLTVKGGVTASTLTTSGNVGIGTTVPAYKLDVAGNLHTSGDIWSQGWIWCNFAGGWFRIDKSGSSAIWVSSDERLKQNIAPIPNAVETLEKLRGVTWNWNDAGLKHLTRDIETSWKSNSGMPGDDQKLWDQKRREAVAELSRPQTGFIAQEVERVYPDWVKTDEQGYKQVNMERLNAVLVNAVKEQQTEIETLKARLGRLEQLLITRNGGSQ